MDDQIMQQVSQEEPELQDVPETLSEDNQEEPAVPEPVRQEELETARRTIAALEQEKQDLEAARDRAVVNYATRAAVAASGTRDPELLEWLLEREKLMLENGQVSGLQEAIDRQRRSRPWLFADGGDRPRFASSVQGKAPGKDESRVAERYRGNPWYGSRS